MDDKDLTRDLLKMINERNILLNKLLHGFIAIIITVVVCLSITLGVVVVSYNNAMTQCVETYFLTPYEYPNMTQEQNVEVNK